MIISTKGRYALKLMMYLAKKNSAEFVPLKLISAQQNIPLKYLESITSILSKKKLVEATSGKGGGYRLSRSPETYSVGEILRAVEGNLSPIACQSEDGSGCGASCDCDARLFWQGLEDQINSYVDNHTLAQFMRVNEKTPAVLSGTERR